MRFLKLAFVVLFLFSGAAYAAGEKGSFKDAERLMDAGEYEKAEDILKKLTAAEPNNARYRQLLGDAYRKEGRLGDALDEYQKAKKLGADNAELHKSMGTTYKWMRDYEQAEESYGKALKLNPRDQEAREDLNTLRQRRGLRLTGMVGGWEADYTKESYEVMLSYGGFDNIDLNAGYSYADQTYYSRDKFYASGYYFYSPNSYLKLYTAYKNYDYPVDPAVQKPNPDSNSYDTVPTFEAELSHWFTDDFRGRVAYEYFRPSFFYDKDATANNHKLSTEAYYITPLRYLRLKAMYAILRDPDPEKTEIKGRDNTNTPLGAAASTEVKYQTQSLLGAGVELVRGKWNAELKYIPNRDLDNSYKYSILTGVGYEFTDRLNGRFDYVYDKYSSKSAYSGKTAKVYLASAFYKLNPSVDLGVGYKYLDLPTDNDSAGFVTLSYKTGILF